MYTVESVQNELKNARQRLDGLRHLPIKSAIDLQLIDDLREHIATLFEHLGELKRERAMDRRYSGEVD